MTRGTRGKAHLQPAFKVAHLAAGGIFPGSLTMEGKLFRLSGRQDAEHLPVFHQCVGCKDFEVGLGEAADDAFVT